MYIEFLTEYWYLFALLLVILLLIGLDPGSRGVRGAKNLIPAQLPQLQSKENTVILDLNAKDKFAEGHIAQSINVPFAELADSIGKIRKHQKKPIILVCENGNHSRKAVPILLQAEFPTLYTLAGGLVTWRKENFPLEKS